MPLESERFIKSYSSLIESPIWPDDGLFKLYHYCLYKASRNVYLWRGIQIQPGEFPMSYRHAAAELCWSRDKLIRKFASLEEADCVCMRKSRVGTLVRVVGWSEIQHTGGSKVSPPWPENQTMSGTEIKPSWYANQTTSGLEIRPSRQEKQTIGGTKIRPNQEEIYLLFFILSRKASICFGLPIPKRGETNARKPRSCIKWPSIKALRPRP